MLSLLSVVSLALYVSAQEVGPEGPGVSSVTAWRTSVSTRAGLHGLAIKEQLQLDAHKAAVKHHWRHFGRHGRHHSQHAAHHNVTLTHPPYVYRDDSTHEKRQQVGVSSPVTNSGDFLYYSNLGIGSPTKQQETTQWDTGSSPLWYPDSLCKTNGATCLQSGNFFDQTQSTTFVNTGKPFSISYVDQSGVTGTVATDSVQFGTLPPLTAFPFGAVTAVSGNIASSPNTGLCGFGFPDNSAGSTGASLPFSYMASGVLAESVFGVYYNTEASGIASTLTLGGPAYKTSADYAYSPLTTNDWVVAANGMYVNGQVVGGAFSADIDTGTSVIVVPTTVASAFWAAIPNSSPVSGGGQFQNYQYPCNFAGTVGFSFAGISQPILLTTSLLNTGPSATSGFCIGSVQGGDLGNNLALLGDSFLTSVPTVFDMGAKRIGFISAAAAPVPSGMRKIRARNSEKRRERVRREQAAAVLHIVD